MRNIFIYLLMLQTFIACNREQDFDFVAYKAHIVVEGEIVNGNYPIVLLSYSAPIEGPKDSLTLLNQVIRNARVSVSDGMNTEILTLQTNSNKIPPYEYVGTQLRGVIGTNYTLLVEIAGKRITGETYIPKPVKIEDIWFTKKTNGDTIGYINMSFANTSKDFYQVATQVLETEKIFTPSLYGNIDNADYPADELIKIQVNKGPVLYPETSYVTYFNEKQPTKVRLRTQPEDAAEFWNSYQNEILNTQNPIFPNVTSLKSNIDGGIGIWSGYGEYTHTITPKLIERAN